ncbi:cytoplasmic dynein 1 intermediate chain 2 [Trichonephila inaurata madagascariensis]|uniref:Cytoplasmic dynein 1 intermediate chain 2 n=1 Tax=Trichonephila inaurata madagascariensis TaxID=2747483 RepID=A0A8X6X1H1_9ARAC|nr:cytoplasmic dynein 1 intermediate chain 2 [Trichonephila inaurata madagascariensis]
MSDRRQELERKKQKLALIREEKEKRRREKAKEAEKAAAVTTTEKDLRAQTEELLESLGIPANESPISRINSSPRSATPETRSTPPDSQPSSAPQSGSWNSKKVSLSLVSVNQVNIPPKEKVNYNKQTQTAATGQDRDAHPLDYYVLTYADMSAEDDVEGSSLTSHEMDTPPLYPNHRPSHKGLPHIEMVRPAQDTAVTTVAEPKKEEKKIRELSEEEKKQIMLREEFHQFFDRASRIIERALYEDLDILIDYTGTREEQEGDDKSGIKLSLNRTFFDDRWSKNRTVTSFDWSSQFPELLVASYNNNEDSPHDPDGVCLVWNMKFKKTTPEYIFHCQSAVMSTCFAKFHPNLVLGGTYSGQIVLWDNRSSKRTPVQRSPLSAIAHTHPVYCIQVVGTQNAHNLVSISTDGKFCTWSLDMLSAPQDTMELSHQKQSRPVSVTSLSFPSGDYNNFIVGSEEGTIYTACRHGSKAGIHELFEGHQGPVTGISSHGAQGHIDFSHLFLSSSMDWTVKLWSLKDSKPLYSFEDNGDYVCDVAWSPVHPSVFACVDGMGRLDVWNLNNDTELPTVSVVADGNPALNRVVWTPSGHQVAVGDDLGRVYIYDVGEQLATPKNDEWSRFVHTLQELENNKADQELDTINNLTSGNSYLLPIR